MHTLERVGIDVERPIETASRLAQRWSGGMLAENDQLAGEEQGLDGLDLVAIHAMSHL